MKIYRVLTGAVQGARPSERWTVEQEGPGERSPIDAGGGGEPKELEWKQERW